MNGIDWVAPVTDIEAFRRAGGRRAYNALRRIDVEIRRIDVMRLLRSYGFRHGVQARIARELAVSEATISRDIAALRPSHVACPTCESCVDPERLPVWMRKAPKFPRGNPPRPRFDDVSGLPPRPPRIQRPGPLPVGGEPLGHPRWTGSSVRYRGGSQVHRRGLSSASDGPSAASSILALSRD